MMETIFDDRAMILKQDREVTLLIADLHLGYEHELAQRGVVFPEQHPLLFRRLMSLIKKYSATQLYIIGDVKHTIMTDSHFNWSIVPEFMVGISRTIPTYVIPGNHDGNLMPLLPRSVYVCDVHGICIGEKETVGLIHGHAWPSSDVLDSELIVLSHNHPTIRSVRSIDVPDLGRPDRRRFAGIIPVIVKSQLDKNCVRRRMGILEKPDDEKGVLVMLPSFNDLLSGAQLNSSENNLQGPIFDNGCASTSESDIYSTGGVYLGTVKELRVRFNEIIK